jgi:hypothetical protein
VNSAEPIRLSDSPCQARDILTGEKQGHTSSAAVFHDPDYDCAEVEDFAFFGGDEVQGDVGSFHQLLRHGVGYFRRGLLCLEVIARR